MIILFRVDASLKIGTGHVMRCLTLAKELKSQGETTVFCSRHLTDTLAGIIQSAGHQLVRLVSKESINKESINIKDIDSIEPNDQYSSWLETSQNFDADEMVSKIKMEEIDWVIVDHYALDIQWQKKIKDKNNNIKLLVINDLFEKSHYCELFLNQNIVKDKGKVYQSLLHEEVFKLIGPNYALLRDEFNEYRKVAKLRNSGLKNILIFFGGIDINNTTGKALIALSKINQDFNVKVVVGATHPKIDELDKFCDSFGFSLHVQVNNMAELMVWADLSIGASGSATWERSCLGLPTVVLSLADNQIPIAKAANDAGLVYYLGKDEGISPLDISNVILEIRDNPQRLARMSEVCFDSVDGLGKKRVVDKIRELS